MNIDKTILEYRSFLHNCWGIISDILDGEHLSDWFQANWEILVESKLCKTPSEFLEIYGEGADCNNSSSRVWYPEGTSSHCVRCKTKEGDSILDVLTGRPIDPIELTFCEFSGWDGKTYGQFLPFDYILLENSISQYLVRVNDVNFYLCKT